MRVRVLACISFFIVHFGQSQDTLGVTELEDVMISATRYERSLTSLPMPATLISNTQIKSAGSMRLNDILNEQTGLVIVPGVMGSGSGLQLQGFDPAYTLLLLDGEPIIGRMGGQLELSRISVRNIKRIEIVKGPSSSLYGSDALAGVVNIITEKPKGKKFNLYTRYGTNNTWDINGDVTFTKKKYGVYLSLNRHQSDGYDLSPDQFGKTVSPFKANTLSGNIFVQLTPKTKLSLSGKSFAQKQEFAYEVIQSSKPVRTFGEGLVHELNINPVLNHRFSNQLKGTLRYYYTGYRTQTELLFENGSLNYSDQFAQTFSRPELMVEYYSSPKNLIVLGAGIVRETVETDRYGKGEKRHQNTYYGYVQNEWSSLSKLTLIAGGRFDYNSVYGSQFSPKLSGLYRVNKHFQVKGSYGIGFKSPDFRQLYYNFTNQAAGGYIVLGTEAIQDRLNQMKAEGTLKNVYFNMDELGKLKAEVSHAVNVGGSVELGKSLKLDINFFNNFVNNLIESQLVASNTSDQNIYSFRNVRRTFFRGLEFNAIYTPIKYLQLNFGYQLLYAKDRDKVKEVRQGEVYFRDPTTQNTFQLKPSEYFGLYNRSRHQGNIKIMYNNPTNGWGATMRVLYRSRYGIGDISGSIQGETVLSSDINSNSILDIYDRFIPGFFQINLSAKKEIKKIGVTCQVGIDNVFDYTEPAYMPNLPGRLLYCSVNYTFSNKQ